MGAVRRKAIVTGADLGADGTELVIHQRHVPEPMRTPGARDGFVTRMDKRVQHVAYLIKGERP